MWASSVAVECVDVPSASLDQADMKASVNLLRCAWRRVRKDASLESAAKAAATEVAAPALPTASGMKSSFLRHGSGYANTRGKRKKIGVMLAELRVEMGWCGARTQTQ